VPEDRAAVDQLLRLAGGRPVLELGIGTGRVACQVARHGIPVWGIDSSSSMVERIAEKEGGQEIRVVVGDMAELKLPWDAPSFGVVYAAFNTLFCLPSLESQRRCLKRSAEVLNDDGYVVVESFVPTTPPASRTGQIDVGRIDHDRVVLKVSKWVPDTGAVIGSHVELSNGGVRVRPWELHPLTVEQLDLLAADALLELDSRYGTWDGGGFFAHSQRHVSVYRRR
jgi:SAM-dependent methyltransferase